MDLPPPHPRPTELPSRPESQARKGGEARPDCGLAMRRQGGNVDWDFGREMAKGRQCCETVSE
jgi:hypothetical protein